MSDAPLFQDAPSKTLRGSSVVRYVLGFPGHLLEDDWDQAA